jgi:hypothetical protein
MSDLSITDEISTPRRLFAASSKFPTYAGVGVIAVGFVLIGIGWAKVAGLADVSMQMPYLVSAGISGLALVMVGLVVVVLAARRQDGDDLARQVERLTSVLEDLQRSLETDGRK